MTLGKIERLATLLKPRPPAEQLDRWRVTEEQLDRLPPSVRDYMRRGRELGCTGPKASAGTFRQMIDGAICLANQTAIAGTSETAMFPVTQYTGFVANQLRAGQIWHLTAFGIITTPASGQGNITITPRYGTTTSGTSLGASAATALVASATNAVWRLEYDFIVRSVGNAGANSNVVGSGFFLTSPAVIAASTGQPVLFGSTANVAVDTSIAAGLFIGVTMGSASDSMTTLGVMLEALN